MTPEEARARMVALPAARDRWLAKTAATVRAQALWLAGSLGRGAGDAWSDVDLIVVDGELDLGDALLTLERPDNGPIGGRYVGAMYDIGPLTLWVDWYQWPSNTPTPSGTRLLSGQGSPGALDLREALDQIGRGQGGPPPDPDVFALAMLPLAAKFVARDNRDAAKAMADMLGAPPHLDLLDGLTTVLAHVQGHAAVRNLVGRYLQVVRALTPD